MKCPLCNDNMSGRDESAYILIYSCITCDEQLLIRKYNSLLNNDDSIILWRSYANNMSIIIESNLSKKVVELYRPSEIYKYEFIYSKKLLSLNDVLINCPNSVEELNSIVNNIIKISHY